jgi:ubiquinone/menaquinone biosynthesis C-methylase UbiE
MRASGKEPRPIGTTTVPNLFFRNAFRIINKMFHRDYVQYENVRLAPPHMRFCTTDLRQDRLYVQSAEREVERLMAVCGLNEGSSLLDIGSGQGRLAIGIQRRLPNIKHYIGVDVHAPSVAWCNRHIGRLSRLRFMHINVHNARYNKKGEPVDSRFHLPFVAASFDIVYLYAVFTNMTAQQVSVYLGEIARVLKPNGRMFATFYVEENVPDYEENPEGYMVEKFGGLRGPLHCCRFRRGYVEQLIDAAGMRLLDLKHQCESQSGQSVLIARRSDESGIAGDGF